MRAGILKTLTRQCDISMLLCFSQTSQLCGNVMLSMLSSQMPRKRQSMMSLFVPFPLYSCLQGNSSDSPVPSTSESSTPSGRRPSSQTPNRSRPHISYSPLVCRTHPSVGEDEDEQGSPETMRRGKSAWKTQEGVAGERGSETSQHPSPPRRYPSEPFLVSQEDDHSPDPSGPMETLTFEAAVACSLGRANTISSARPRLRTGWQVPNGHFRKRLAQTVSVAGCDALSDTEEDDRC